MGNIAAPHQYRGQDGPRRASEDGWVVSCDENCPHHGMILCDKVPSDFQQIEAQLTVNHRFHHKMKAAHLISHVLRLLALRQVVFLPAAQ